MTVLVTVITGILLLKNTLNGYYVGWMFARGGTLSKRLREGEPPEGAWAQGWYARARPFESMINAALVESPALRGSVRLIFQSWALVTIGSSFALTATTIDGVPNVLVLVLALSCVGTVALEQDGHAACLSARLDACANRTSRPITDHTNRPFDVRQVFGGRRAGSMQQCRHDEHEVSLAEILQRAGIDAVDVVGLATDHCVRATALDAKALGFAVRVLSPLVAGVAPDSSARALDDMRAAGITVV